MSDKNSGNTVTVKPLKSFEDNSGVYRRAGSEPFEVSRDEARDLRANGLVGDPDDDAGPGGQPVLRDGAQDPTTGAKRAPAPLNKAMPGAEVKDAAADPRPAAPTPAVAPAAAPAAARPVAPAPALAAPSPKAEPKG